ncbi:MAG: LacI family DNA-binding transcriptional regulator [Planctomycetota bacterium]|jgi:LacI family repressor for deo operon, udp, cdd, tsx, nupC, and nupG|nr:LacI family DNA-binding transcriptional regulator [Planctomycetota bacterium]
MTTQKRIAEILDITQATVSTAFRHPDAVAPETRRRIYEVAQEIGYTRHAAATSMATGRHGRERFGSVVLLREARAFTGRPIFTLDALVDTFEQHDLSLVLANLVNDNEHYVEPRPLRYRMADGMIVFLGGEPCQALSAQLSATRMPLVFVDQKGSHNRIYLDDHGAAVTLTEHLIAAGHRRIAYLDPALTVSDAHHSRPDRLAGYRAAMTAAALKPQLVAPGPESDAAPSGVKRLLAGANAPTAIIAYSEYHLAACFQAATDLGLRVPQDLSVASFDESPTLFGARLTTMIAPREACGRHAADMLLGLINEPEQAQPSLVLPWSLDRGETVASPPT